MAAIVKVLRTRLTYIYTFVPVGNCVAGPPNSLARTNRDVSLRLGRPSLNQKTASDRPSLGYLLKTWGSQPTYTFEAATRDARSQPRASALRFPFRNTSYLFNSSAMLVAAMARTNSHPEAQYLPKANTAAASADQD